ncbi:haloacid dehalogenase type II [Sphingomonas sp. GC_Shp_2]|uniref:haloacid dehalogenase type II n=1 Tax=Sphingomonas sp. GC_Shp_2 TaxID=2937384 RepID=UPI00226AC9C5|nr:haloacid dehalogenase type II [Sphingomonas sp. GC_Shp_2]
MIGMPGTSQSALPAPPDGPKPILVFDIVETILDTESLAPVFDRIFQDGQALRSWLDNLFIYSEALTIVDIYADAGTLGIAVVEMMARSRGIKIHPQDLATLKHGLGSMPAYPDVSAGLRRLRELGYRLVTLSNSPTSACETQLRSAGIRDDFERLFSIDDQVKRYKPARETYLGVAAALSVPPSDLWLISCHAFDVMGAKSAGLHAAFVSRPGNAPIAVGPQPDLIVPNLGAFATALAQR